MTDIRATLRARLDAAVGSAQVLTAPADVAPYLTDWRGRYHGHAQAVVRPGSTSEVAAVVRACADASVPIVAQGGNTGQCGGATPDASGDAIVISLARMNRVRAVDADNATLTVEAGATLAAVQEAATAAGLLFPLSLAAEGSCTIGGNLSTNAGGTAVLRFGNARELTLGIEVVLADGRIWDGLRGLRKDNTGYDLKQLFIGAEGTLGIVTAAVLKLFPAPQTRATAFAALGDVRAAIDLLRALRQALGDRLVGFELISGPSLALTRRHFPDAARPAARPPLVRARAGRRQRGKARRSPPISNGRSARRSNAERRATPPSHSRASRPARCGRCARTSPRRSASTARTSSTTSRCRCRRFRAFLDAAETELAAALPGVRFVTFGHLGDGNLHYNLAAPAGIAAGRLPRAYGGREPDRPRPGRRAQREHQRRARHRAAEEGRARPLQERGRARSHARDQGGA